MRYIAQVVKKPLSRSSKFLIVATRRNDGLWVPVNDQDQEMSLPLNNADLNDGILVILDLDERRQIIRISSAVSELVEEVKTWGLRLSKLDEEEKKNVLWRESLEYQGQEFFKRSALIEVKEKKMQQWEDSLRTMALSLEKKAALLEQEKEKIQLLWEQLSSEQKRKEEYKKFVE